MISCRFEITVKIVRSDDENDFNCMHGYFHQSDIIFQTSCTGTPQQNGGIERNTSGKIRKGCAKKGP